MEGFSKNSETQKDPEAKIVEFELGARATNSARKRKRNSTKKLVFLFNQAGGRLFDRTFYKPSDFKKLDHLQRTLLSVGHHGVHPENPHGIVISNTPIEDRVYQTVNHGLSENDIMPRVEHDELIERYTAENYIQLCTTTLPNGMEYSGLGLAENSTEVLESLLPKYRASRKSR